MALDRWVLARTRALQAEITDAYRRYAFHLIYQKVHNFCSVDLGGLYLDVIKDRMYTTALAGAARRSAQTVMFHIAESMVRWLAPILSFTAEEAWRYLPGERPESVFHATWHELPAAPADAHRLAGDCSGCAPTSRASWRSCATRARSARRWRRAWMSTARRAEYPRFCRARAGAAVPAHHLARRRARVRRAAAAGGAGGRTPAASGVWIARGADPGAEVRALLAPPRAMSARSSRHPQLCLRCVSNVEGPGERAGVRMNELSKSGIGPASRTPHARCRCGRAAGAGCR